MKSFTKKNDNIAKIVPRYAVIPFVILLIINVLVYMGTRVITDGMNHFDISGYVDHKIPFLPVFSVPYMLAYVQWFACFIVVSRYEKNYCYKVMCGEMIAKVLAGVIFLLFPTTMLRAEINGTDIFSQAVGMIYRLDAPTNLFPSIHCLESYICMRVVIEMKSADKSFRIANVIMSLLVFMSTVFIKQHVVLDFFGAVIVAEAGRFLSELFFRISFYYIEKDRKGKDGERYVYRQ